MKATKIYLLLVLGLILFLASCKKDNDSGSDQPDVPNQEDKFVFDVQWTDQTVYFDEDALGDLVKVDTADYRYYFKSSSTTAAALAPGNILVIHGLALRKVSTVNTVDNQIIVETAYAKLNEAVSDGEIEWDYGVNFNTTQIPQLVTDENAYPFKQISSDSFSIKLKIGKYDYEISMKFKGDHAEVKQTIEKKVAGALKLRFTCEGSIEQFRTSNKMSYSHSNLTYYENENKNLKGELTVKLNAAGSGNDMINMEFPATLLTFPFNVGPIPTVVSVKVQFVAQAVVPPAGSSIVSAKFTYNSNTGLGYSLNGGVIAKGGKGTYNIEKKEAQTGAPGAIGINFGLGFPRIEVGVFGQVIVPWAQTAFLVGGDYTFNPACQQAKAAYIGACGYKLSFLGYEAEGTKTLWNEEKILLQSGNCGKSDSYLNIVDILTGEK